MNLLKKIFNWLSPKNKKICPDCGKESERLAIGYPEIFEAQRYGWYCQNCKNYIYDNKS